MTATLNPEAAGLPLVALFVQNGESRVWTPHAIRCRNAASRLNPHPVVYLTPAFYEKQRADSLHFYQDEQHIDCPRCNTMSGGTLLSPAENPKPGRIELPVLHESPNAGHRALVAALAGHAWTARSTYFARDLAFWTRQSLECHDAPEQWAVVVSEAGLNLVARGQFQAPERLGGSIGAQRDFLLYVWDGNDLRQSTVPEAMAWIVGEDENMTRVEPRCKEMAVSVPSCDELRASLPWRLREKIAAHDSEARQTGRWTFQQRYEYEIMNMLMSARRCEAPTISMGLFRHESQRQWVCFFSCSDRARARTGETNWHLQNTSQWVYAGALTVDHETGDLSSHH